MPGDGAAGEPRAASPDRVLWRRSVVIDTQRGGPSTGMPTKMEQSDLLAMVSGGHGEAPRIVIAPGTGDQAFYDTVDEMKPMTSERQLIGGLLAMAKRTLRNEGSTP